MLILILKTSKGLKITGELPLSGGDIFYFERNFYLKEGSVKFVNDANEKIDPLLSARAVIREVSSNSEMTKIYLIVDEAPLSKFFTKVCFRFTTFHLRNY